MTPEKPTVTIHKDLCKACGLCIIHCPKGILSSSDQINALGYPTTVVSGEGCIGCANCYIVCPEPGAITVTRPDKGGNQNVTADKQNGRE